MSAIMQEAVAPSTIVTTGEAQSEYSQEYSKGELEEMDSFELLDGYAEQFKWTPIEHSPIFTEGRCRGRRPVDAQNR